MKFASTAIALALAVACSGPAAAKIVDGIRLGDAASETAHGFADATGASVADKGANGLSCRRMKKPDGARWRTDAMKFRLKVAKDAPTYLTCRLWGSDTSHDHLFCTVDGKMLGQMHLGEYDILDYESCWPRDSNRETADAEHFGAFTYRTFLLPENLTKGKDEIEVAVYAAGHVWGYGTNFEQFQKMVSHDSRGLYVFATHTEPMEASFKPKHTRAWEWKPAEQAKDPDVVALAAKVEKHLIYLMQPGVLAGRRREIGFLAEAYNTEGCLAYRNPGAIKAIVAAVDAGAQEEAESPGGTTKKDSWRGAADEAVGVCRVGADAIRPFLDEKRRAAWTFSWSVRISICSCCFFKSNVGK